MPSKFSVLLRVALATMILASVLISCAPAAPAKQAAPQTMAPVAPTTAPVPVRFRFDTPPFWSNQAKKLTDAGIPVSFEAVPFPSLHDNLTAMFASGASEVDVIHIHELWAKEWASKGWLEPLDNLVPEIKTPDWPDSAFLKVQGPDGKEHIYGVGLYAWISLLYCRQDILDKGGVKEWPKTYDDLIAMVSKLQTAETPGLMIALGGASASSVFGTILWTEGGEMLDKNDKPAFNSEAGLRALDKLVAMNKVLAPVSFQQTSNSLASEAFVAGGAVCAVAPPPTLNLAGKSPIAGKVSVGVMPGGSKLASATYSETGSRAIAAGSTNKGMAWQYIKAVTSASEVKAMTMELGRVPLLTSVLNDPEVAKTYPISGVVAEQLKYRVGMPVAHPKGVEFNKAVSDNILPAIRGEIAPKVALDRAEKAVREILEK